MEHTLDGFLKFAEPLGIKNKIIAWDLPITTEDHDWAKQHLPAQGPVLIVNPAASKPERSWPIACYIELLAQAQAKWGLHVVLTGDRVP